MTGDETCGVFIPEGVVVGKVAEPMGGSVTGRGGWSHNRLWKGKAYTGSNRRNGPDFGMVFLMLNYTEKPQNTYIQS